MGTAQCHWTLCNKIWSEYFVQPVILKTTKAERKVIIVTKSPQNKMVSLSVTISA